MRIVRFAVLFVLVGLVSAAAAQATGYKATIYFRSGNSVKIDHFGTTTEVGTVTLYGILNGQQVKFNLGDLAQVDFTDSNSDYYCENSKEGTVVITNKQGKRFTATSAWIQQTQGNACGAVDYTYQDPVTGKLTATSAEIKDNVASITIGAGTGGAHEGQMKKDPATGEFFPATYLYDPYTGAQLIWANPQ